VAPKRSTNKTFKMPSLSPPMASKSTMDDDEEVDTSAKRAYVRRGYRQLLDRVVQDEDEEDDDQREAAFEDVLDDMNELYKEVHDPGEALLDAKLLRRLTNRCRRQTEALSANATRFSLTEFADRLSQTMGQQKQMTVNKWATLGDAVKSLFRRAPVLTYLNGAFEEPDGEASQRSAPERKKRQSRAADDSALNATQATQVEARETSADTTEALVQSTLKQLVSAYKSAGKRAICYFTFVIHPGSFASTVENIFHVSFLVKEGKARISKDVETNLPLLLPLSGKDPSTSNPEDANVPRQQVVMTLSPRDWRALKEYLDVRKASIHLPGRFY